MIVGSGMIARAFARHFDQLGTHCVYAAGVSNSSCKDASEFARDRARLEATLDQFSRSAHIVYISTCSVSDAAQASNPYVLHKAALERLVLESDVPSLIVRLPQLAGDTPNPHTLLNYLFARIARSERFELWVRARRNVIDVEDATKIIVSWLASGPSPYSVVNVANPRSNSMWEIVEAFEVTTGRKAVFERIEKGGACEIDIAAVLPSILHAGVDFGHAYLLRTITKYFGARGVR